MKVIYKQTQRNQVFGISVLAFSFGAQCLPSDSGLGHLSQILGQLLQTSGNNTLYLKLISNQAHCIPVWIYYCCAIDMDPLYFWLICDFSGALKEKRQRSAQYVIMTRKNTERQLCDQTLAKGQDVVIRCQVQHCGQCPLAIWFCVISADSQWGCGARVEIECLHCHWAGNAMDALNTLSLQAPRVENT